MRTGILGLGKVGSVLAAVLAAAGHAVTGYDPDPAALARLAELPGERVPAALRAAGRTVVLAASPADVIAASDIVFAVTATPHAPGYGGETPAPLERRDFGYAFLVQGCRSACDAARAQGKDITLVVVSTVLPGTMSRLVRPLAGEHVTVVYNPALIALGNVAEGLARPPAVIAGADRDSDLGRLRVCLAAVHEDPAGVPWITGSFETAEAAKILWNASLSARITFANMAMEICHKTGADADAVAGALAIADARNVTPGLGAGGPCLPRDLIALSWLARRLDLSFDLPGSLVAAREAQSGWIARLAAEYGDLTGLPVVILGTGYKPGSDLTAGSPALLLAAQLNPAGDPVPCDAECADRPAVFVLGVADREFAAARYAPGSVVIDPWGIVADKPGVTVIRTGRR